MGRRLTHLDRKGRARMVDVGSKSVTAREAVALGEVGMSRGILSLIKNGRMPKGDVLAVARIAGIMAAKKTYELIPLCHPLSIDSIEISFLLEAGRIVIQAKVKSTGKTGVEMEALTAASVAALALYDMCKSQDRRMTIGPLVLASKSGGKSGSYVRRTLRRENLNFGNDASWL